MQETFVWIDPANGWKYYFPKLMPRSVKNPIEWLLNNNYSESELKNWPGVFYCTYWDYNGKNRHIVYYKGYSKELIKFCVD